MEMHQIRYFLATVGELNFTKAAEKCNVTQPSLTRAIKQLEDMPTLAEIYADHAGPRLQQQDLQTRIGLLQHGGAHTALNRIQHVRRPQEIDEPGGDRE